MVEAVQDGQPGGSVCLGLEGVVESGDAQGGVQIVAHLGAEFFPVLRQDRLVHRAVGGVQGGDFGDQLLERPGGVVQVFPGKDQALPVVALEAEEAVDKRVVALLLQQGDG